MRWFRGLFGKKRNALPPVPDSPENWQAGDLAECIVIDGWYNFPSMAQHSDGPINGEARMVSEVVLRHDIQCLRFSRWPRYFGASAFRKITPRADETGIADADFVRELNRAKEPAQ